MGKAKPSKAAALTPSSNRAKRARKARATVPGQGASKVNSVEIDDESPEGWAASYLEELSDPDTDVELIGYMRNAKSGRFGPTLETFCVELQKRLVTLVQNHGLPAPGTASMSLAAEDAVDGALTYLGHMESFIDQMIGRDEVHSCAWPQMTALQLLAQEVRSRLAEAEENLSTARRQRQPPTHKPAREVSNG